MRKPLTGQLSIRIQAVKDVDHAATSRFARGPETFVAIKVEDNVVARTKTSRTDKPPPLTKYLSTPGGKVLKPGFRISKLVWLFSIYSYTISIPNILAMDIDSQKMST